MTSDGFLQACQVFYMLDSALNGGGLQSVVGGLATN
jgi:hypothetical protein